MTDQDLVEVGSPSRPEERSTRLCVVSGKRLVCGQFIAVLQTALNPYDEFEIVMDRRRERARPDGLDFRDRRHLPHVDRLLKVDGFAIVPDRAAARGANRTPLSPPPPEVTIERARSQNREDEERLESIRNFIRERSARRTTSVVFAGLMSAAVVLLALSPAVTSLISSALLEAPSEDQPGRARQDNDPGAEGTQPPPVTANPAVVPQPGLPEASAPTTSGNPPTDAVSESPTPSVVEPTRSVHPRTTKNPSGRAQEGGAAVGVVPDPRVIPAPEPDGGAQPPPIVGASPPATPVVRTAAPRFLGQPRVNVVRSPATTGADLGESYALRISDSAGRPLAGADVSLFARVAASTVQSFPPRPGPEPATYHGSVPGNPTAVDLRVRVTTSDKRVARR